MSFRLGHEIAFVQHPHLEEELHCHLCGVQTAKHLFEKQKLSLRQMSKWILAAILFWTRTRKLNDCALLCVLNSPVQLLFLHVQ
jgi:hypothetical protein